jgi:hypothetical protein
MEIPVEIVIGTVPLRPQLVNQNKNVNLPLAPSMLVPSFDQSKLQT